jgi:phosphoribosylformimino-5-aminoimidazole carboxamide ribotide isomerase
MMEIIPAIDIRGGKCVRLYQGDYERETVYADDPVETALRWEAEGGRTLHLVDLDGARSGRPENFAAIRAVCRAVSMVVEVGGGVRTRETVDKLLGAGVRRVVLGTVAVEEPELVRDLLRDYTTELVIGIDAKGGKVATRGWLKGSGETVVAMAQAMATAGARRFIYTDISRDGTLTTPNFTATGRLVKSVSVPVVASGGVARLEHLKRLAKLGAEGAIVGRALYTGDLDLKEAIAAVKGVGGA